MQRFRSRWAAKGVLLAAAALATAAGAWGATTTRGASHSSSASATLVVDRSFEIKTADPQRAFEPTAAIVDRGIYDTFFTYRGNDLAHPIPLLVKTWTASKNAKTFVFHLRTNVHFADGTPLTAKDAVFSFRRLINLKGNPAFLLDGVTPSARGRYTVVLRSKTPNTALPSILTNTSLGVAIDLSADQAQTIRRNTRLNVRTSPSTWIFFMLANNNPQVSTVTSNRHFQAAVRYGLDYGSLARLAGPGSIQAPGVIPNMFLGSLPRSAAIKRNLAKARSELQASGAAGKTITLEYPSDLTINGVPFPSLAQRVQANLQQAGFKIDLAGSTVGTWLQKYRDGKMAFGLSLWGPDYPDPADYLVFTPGDLVGLRAGWPKGGDPTTERLAAKARVTTKAKARQTVFRAIQRRLNAVGPFFPLIQPTQVFVATKDLRNAVFNAQYQVDVTRVSPR